MLHFHGHQAAQKRGALCPAKLRRAAAACSLAFPFDLAALAAPAPADRREMKQHRASCDHELFQQGKAAIGTTGGIDGEHAQRMRR